MSTEGATGRFLMVENSLQDVFPMSVGEGITDLRERLTKKERGNNWSKGQFCYRSLCIPIEFVSTPTTYSDNRL